MCRASPVNRLTCLVRILQTVFKTFIQRIGKAMRMKVIDLLPRPHAPNAAAENFHYLHKKDLRHTNTIFQIIHSSLNDVFYMFYDHT